MEETNTIGYWSATAKDSDEQMEAVHGRLLELLHHLLHRRAYRKRAEVALEIVTQLEQEGLFPAAHYAFDNGLLTLELTRYIESVGKHGVSELECSRHIQWQGQWQRVDTVAQTLRQAHPESGSVLKVEMTVKSRGFTALKTEAGGLTHAAYLHF